MLAIKYIIQQVQILCYVVFRGILMKNKNNQIKLACYTANITMSAVIILPPLLFADFRQLYNISFAQLGLLVLINFIAQMLIDLIFTFFSHKFNINATVKSIPFIAIAGFLLYALFPMFAPNFAYVGLVMGTIIFASASGLAEVLISPVIAALPADNPEREMSKLHSMYAWGVVGVTVFSTLLLNFLSAENWYALVLLMLFVPSVCALLFLGVKLPEMKTHKASSGVFKLFKNKSMIFCFALIFFGGASENIISQWSSSYLEQNLQLPKIWGDILGVALFATMLGIGRTLYAHKGKNILNTMLFGAVGAVICYVLLIFVNLPIIGLFACAFSGYCVAMLWPGSLIIVQEKVPGGGVAMFALMASGGDLGSAIAPQLVGFVADITLAFAPITNLGNALGFTQEQMALKSGLLIALIFPVMASVLLFVNYTKTRKKI